MFVVVVLCSNAHSLICKQIAAELNKTVEVLQAYWNDIWEKYKACKDAEKHTGGGDGDAERVKQEENEEEEKGGKKQGKRKRRKTKVRGGKWSQEFLDKFRESKVYSLIDDVFVSLFLSDDS